LPGGVGIRVRVPRSPGGRGTNRLVVGVGRCRVEAGDGGSEGEGGGEGEGEGGGGRVGGRVGEG